MASDNTDMNRVINSTWHVLEQAPPPSLREVLGAYNARGDGDRDMLIAMLNAKSAEDQRMASVAALHRTLLEMHGASPSSPHISLPQLHPGSHYYDSAPPMYAQESRRSPPHSETSHPSSSSQTSRKRQRTSHHPASPISTSSRRSNSPRHRHPSPSSPRSRSSSRSDSAEYSPRSRASMTIGSLLSSSSAPSNGEPRRAHYDHHHYADSHGRVNGYISPPSSLGPISV